MRHVLIRAASLLVALAACTAVRAADFDFAPAPSDFTYSRLLDGMGGGNTYVVDELQAVFPIAPTSVSTGSYRFRFDFPSASPVVFCPHIARIDIDAALGGLGDYASMYGSSGFGPASANFTIDNLTFTSASGSTVQFTRYASSQADGVGIFKLLYVDGASVQSGEPFILRSLDVTFDIRADVSSYDLPVSPADSVSLVLGAGAVVPDAELAGLSPMLQAVPEPGVGVVILLAGVIAAARRRRA